MLEAARREESRVGKLRDFRRRGARRRQDLRDAADRPAPRKKDGYDVVVGVVETHGRKETEALLEGLEVIPRRQVEYKGQGSRRWTSTPSSPAGRRSCWSTSSPTPMPPAAAIPSAISTSRSCLNSGIDVYTTVNIQHIESLNDVVAQITHVRVRETVPDFDLRPRRRGRAGRSHAGRSDPAPEGRQGLRPEAGRAGARALLLARQSDGAARAGACAAPPSGSTSSCSARCRRRRSPGRGRPASAFWSASARIRARPGWCAMPSAWPTGCMRRGRRSTSRPAAACSSARSSATASPTRCVWPSAWRRGDHDPGRRSAHRRRCHRLRASQQRHADRHRQIDPLALVRDSARLGRARSRAPLRQYQRPRHRRRRRCRRADRARRRSAPPTDPKRSIRALICSRSSRSRLRSASAKLIEPWFGIENVDLVFLTAVVGVAVRYRLVAVAAGQRRGIALLQFLLPAADLHLHDRRSDQRRGVLLLHRHGGHRLQRGCARAHAGGRGDGAGARRPSRFTPSAASSPAPARSTTCFGPRPIRPRLMLKVRVVLLLPENGSIAVKAGYPPEDTLDEADLAAAKWAWENNRPAGRGSDTLPGRQATVPADAHRPRRHRRRWHRQRQARAAADARSATAARRADRSGALAIERVHLVEDMDRVKRTVETDRLALRAADLDLARPQDAARRGARCGGHASRSVEQARAMARRLICSATIIDEVRAAQPLHRQPARHDQAGIRRDRAERRAA